MNYAPSLDRRSAVRLTGAVYTPSDVAAAVIRFAAKGLPRRHLSVLEPSVGDGAFLGQLATWLPEHDYLAIDIDEAVVDRLRENATSWPATTTLNAGDFIEYACDAIESTVKRFDFIVGNPPFVRKHNFGDAFKDALDRLSETIDYPRQNLKNSWAAFLLASAHLVTDDGVVAFVLPYELITVSYGQAALVEMLGAFSRIDLFISDKKAFSSIEQDAVIFIGRKQTHEPGGLFVQRVTEMSKLDLAVQHRITIAPDRPLALDLNGFLLDPGLMPALRSVEASLQKFSDLATSATGVVTAANEFFILRDADVQRLSLQDHVLPILKKQSIVDRSPVFSTNDFDQLAAREPCRLLHIRGALEDLDTATRSYIAEGAKLGLPDRYKCVKRKNWYEVRLVEKTPGFFFKRSHGYPRICINQAGVYITDTAYGITPKGGYTMRGICYSFYNSLTMLFAETNGRFYGGGVLELSPNELKGLPIAYREPTDEEFEAFLKVHRESGNDPTPVLDFGDNWLKGHPVAKRLDLIQVRQAWTAVRSHRMRHGNRPAA